MAKRSSKGIQKKTKGATKGLSIPGRTSELARVLPKAEQAAAQNPRAVGKILKEFRRLLASYKSGSDPSPTNGSGDKV